MNNGHLTIMIPLLALLGGGMSSIAILFIVLPPADASTDSQIEQVNPDCDALQNIHDTRPSISEESKRYIDVNCMSTQPLEAIP